MGTKTRKPGDPWVKLGKKDWATIKAAVALTLRVLTAKGATEAHKKEKAEHVYSLLTGRSAGESAEATDVIQTALRESWGQANGTA